MKNKPLMFTALIFGGVGAAVIILAIVLYMAGDKNVYSAIASFFGMGKDKITTATICQLGILFEISAFILAHRSLAVECQGKPQEIAVSAEENTAEKE